MSIDGPTREPMGFGGLVELVSPLPPMPVVAPSAASIAAVAPAVSSPVVQRARGSGLFVKARQWGVWLLVAAALVGFRAMASFGAHTPSNMASSYVPSPARFETANDAVGPESKPLATTGQSLSREQIRYCLAEKVRLTAIREKADGNVPVVRRMFENKVNDYNSRCVGYLYRQADMTAASRVVEETKSQLQSEADIWR